MYNSLTQATSGVVRLKWCAHRQTCLHSYFRGLHASCNTVLIVCLIRLAWRCLSDSMNQRMSGVRCVLRTATPGREVYCSVAVMKATPGLQPIAEEGAPVLSGRANELVQQIEQVRLRLCRVLRARRAPAVIALLNMLASALRQGVDSVQAGAGSTATCQQCGEAGFGGATHWLCFRCSC